AHPSGRLEGAAAPRSPRHETSTMDDPDLETDDAKPHDTGVGRRPFAVSPRRPVGSARLARIREIRRADQYGAAHAADRRRAENPRQFDRRQNLEEQTTALCADLRGAFSR